MNFCDGCLDPRITSNKPARDNYEVDNLISCDGTAKRRGFMGEYFIRAPVDVTIDFPVPIDVSHLRVGVRLEHLCTTGISIYTRPEGCNQGGVSLASRASCSSVSVSSANMSTSNISTSSSLVPTSMASSSTTVNPSFSSSDSIRTKACHASTSSHLPTSKNRVASNTKNEIVIKDDVYFCVGKFFTREENELILKNFHYKHWIRAPLPAVDNVTEASSTFRGTMKHTNRQALRCVKSLILQILRTSKTGPPVISLLEVWGQPGITTSKTDRKELFRKWAARGLSQEPALSIPRIYNSQPEETKITKSLVDTSSTKDILDIPEDFLDPLTCDIMTVPFLLPSGHSIDAHTLERYISNESTWGRPASDPFTGVPFRAGRQPSPNVPLKARIDRFLLLNGDHPDIKTCARTVGSALTTAMGVSGITSSSNKRPAEDALHPNQPAIKVHAGDTVTLTESDLDLEKQFNTDDDSDSLEAEIEKALEGKPKYLPESVKSKILNKTLATDKSSTSALKKQTSVSRTLKRQDCSRFLNGASSIAVKSEHKKNMQKTGSGHGFVQMIGGALSVSQGKAAARGIPTHELNAKPRSLICGDNNSKIFDVTALSSISCVCGEQEGLYRFPCDHKLCRSCLLHQEKNKLDIECVTCKKVCKRSHIVKYHKKSLFSC